MSRRHATPDAPWPFLTARAAGELLNVPPELISGLARGNHFRSIEIAGKMGRPVVLCNREDIEALAERMGQER